MLRRSCPNKDLDTFHERTPVPELLGCLLLLRAGASNASRGKAAGGTVIFSWQMAVGDAIVYRILSFTLPGSCERTPTVSVIGHVFFFFFLRHVLKESCS